MRSLALQTGPLPRPTQARPALHSPALEGQSHLPRGSSECTVLMDRERFTGASSSGRGRRALALEWEAAVAEGPWLWARGSSVVPSLGLASWGPAQVPPPCSVSAPLEVLPGQPRAPLPRLSEMAPLGSALSFSLRLFPESRDHFSPARSTPGAGP